MKMFVQCITVGRVSRSQLMSRSQKTKEVHCSTLNDKRIKSCLSRFGQRRLQLPPVSACCQPFCRRSYGGPTAACQQQWGRGWGQSGASSNDVSCSVAIRSSVSCINPGRLLWSVPRGRHDVRFHTGAVWTCTLLWIIRTDEEKNKIIEKFLS